MSELQMRSFELRAIDKETGIIEGRAVPFNDTIELLPGFQEKILPGSVVERSDQKLFYGHKDIIGHVVSSESREDGFYIKAKVSDTTLGRDTLVLLKDGSLDKFSIGFEPLEWTEVDGVTVYSKIDIREVSVVPMPAYEAAQIFSVRQAAESEVREDSLNKEEETEMVDNTAADVTELRATVEDLERRMALATADTSVTAGRAYRTPGDFALAVAGGDENAVREYTALMERAYEGGTTADLGDSDYMQNAWVGDLTKLVEGASVLYNLFSKGPLPRTGNFVEFNRLVSNSVSVSAQDPEGSDLVGPGKLVFETDTAPVTTRGGYVQLTFQEMTRSPINVLNHTLRALAIELGKDLERVVRAAFVAARAANAANAVTVADGDDWADWQNAVIDTAVQFRELGISLDALVVSKDVFKRIAGMTDVDGAPLAPVGSVGVMRAKALTGEIYGVPVVLDELAANGTATFVNDAALRIFTSPVARLQDSNIVNLTGTFSVYQLVAVADEEPRGIVPVTISA